MGLYARLAIFNRNLRNANSNCNYAALGSVRNHIDIFTYISFEVKVLVNRFKACQRISDWRKNCSWFQIEKLMRLFDVPAKMISQANCRMIMLSWPAILVYPCWIATTCNGNLYLSPHCKEHGSKALGITRINASNRLRKYRPNFH